jgi:AhpC/TSA family
MNHCIAWIVGLSLLGGAAGGPVAAPKDRAAVRFTDVAGETHAPLFQPQKKATVLFFVLPDCPVSNTYAPEIKRICTDYEPKQVAAFVIHADPDVTAEAAKKHATAFGLPCPVLRDPIHRLVKYTGVTMAPEVAVIAPDGKVVYRGRIDDRYIDYGKQRAEPRERDLRAALDAVLQGMAVPTPATKVIGCFLPDPKQ